MKRFLYIFIYFIINILFIDGLFILAKSTEEGDTQAWLDAQPQDDELDDYMIEIVRQDDDRRTPYCNLW